MEKQNRLRNYCKTYTADDDDFIRTHWKLYTDQEMSRMMGRNICGVKGRRGRLGLKRQVPEAYDYQSMLSPVRIMATPEEVIAEDGGGNLDEQICALLRRRNEVDDTLIHLCSVADQTGWDQHSDNEFKRMAFYRYGINAAMNALYNTRKAA